VTLSQTAGAPGLTVSMPLYVAGADGVRIGTIHLRLTFPKAKVSFDKAELSGLGEGVGIVMTTEQQDAGDSASVLLTLTTKAVEGAAREAVPDGPIAHLAFKLAADAKVGEVVTLKPRVSAETLDAPPKTVAGISAPDGQIVVSEPSVSSCFFYMH